MKKKMKMIKKRQNVGIHRKISPEIKKQDTIEDKKNEKKGKMSGMFGIKPPEIKKPKRIKKR